MTEEIRPDQVSKVESFLRQLQNDICNALADLDTQYFVEDAWQREGHLQGEGDSRVLAQGSVFERAGVNFSLVSGAELPRAATQQRPELAGRGFKAMGVSVVIHPDNPYVPTSHMNVRFLIAEKAGQKPVWWFGGGFDLTPYYGFDEDCVHWHRTAAEACRPFGEELYQDLKKRCDSYFFLPHRDEPRGIGGLFFDDWNQAGFEQSFGLTRSVGEHFLQAYLPIVDRRKDMPFSDRQKDFQSYRRARYVEFNLVYDRGTLFGLQSGGRTESILMSMPPVAQWRYRWSPQPGSEEARLYTDYLRPRQWWSEDV